MTRAYGWDADTMITTGALDVDAFGAGCLIFRGAADARLMSTPWGVAQSTAMFCGGQVMHVTTSSHGGLLVDRTWATEHLSPAAQRVGRPFARWLAYEEDSDARVVELEVDEIAWCLPEELIEDLRLYHGTYLLERAIAPDAFGGAELVAQLSISELLGDGPLSMRFD